MYPGNLARSLGKHATLNDVLQMMDEHYGIVMRFDTLSKELYSLKQGSGKCGQIWGAPVTAGPDTPGRVPEKDSAQAHGGDEVGLLL